MLTAIFSHVEGTDQSDSILVISHYAFLLVAGNHLELTVQGMVTLKPLARTSGDSHLHIIRRTRIRSEVAYKYKLLSTAKHRL